MVRTSETADANFYYFFQPTIGRNTTTVKLAIKEIFGDSA
jgi:hypothetical protein